LRAATQADRRLEECAKLGLTAVVAPAGTPARGTLRVTRAETIREAIRAGLDAEQSAEGDPGD
jgi:predicted ATP-dependent serine protease